MSFIVYILQSQTTLRYYCGQTDNLEERIKRHNGGEVKSTKHGIYWKVIAIVSCATRVESMQLESTIKKRGIQRWLLENEQYIIR